MSLAVPLVLQLHVFNPQSNSGNLCAGQFHSNCIYIFNSQLSPLHSPDCYNTRGMPEKVTDSNF